MKKLLFLTMAMIFLAGCTKMTVDTNKISEEVSINPAFVIAVSGDVNLSDMIQPGDTILEPRDTILFDDSGLMKLFFYRDSIINFSVSDFYSGFSSESFSGHYDILSTESELIEETIDVDPGDDIELRSMKIVNGDISYSIISTCVFPVTFVLTLTSVLDETLNPIVETIEVGIGETVNGSVDLDNAFVDFSMDGTQAYNRILVSGLVIPGGSGVMGGIDLSIDVTEPDYDYITGYFGMQTEGEENDTIDLGLDELFAGNTDAFFLADPKISMHYKNSFGVPIEVAADVKGVNADGILDLARDAENIMYPTSIDLRDVEASFVIDSSNSELPNLISMFPDEIIYGGSATTNPLGNVGPDNLVFSDSRLLVDLEVEVPMVFWMDNLVLSDTVDNFLMPDEDGESPLDILEELELRMFIDNGFPLGGNFSITLYDSTSATDMSMLETGDFFDPAPVDANGVVTSSLEKSTIITLSDEFMADGLVADKMIIKFTFNTTGSGAQAVRIMSDYSISFRAGILMRAGIGSN